MAGRTPRRGLGTRVVHAGVEPDPTTGAIMTPIYATSTYVQPGLDSGQEHDYARTINPTRTALETSLADLEGGKRAHAFSSGMAAIHAVTALLASGDHLVVSDNVYGGTYRLFEQVLRGSAGLDFSWVDTSDLSRVEEALRPRTRMLFVETPTNPMMALTDLEAAAELARRHRLILVVDNTFATPVFQRPLELGADVVVHSTTKYLNGHSDSVGGAVITRRARHAERIGFVQNGAGAVPGPFDAWLCLRGIKTLALRMRAHDASGRKIAAWLAGRPEVGSVNYPGLKTHPQHRLARRQMGGFGGMVSFDLGSRARARRMLRSVRLFSVAESLGGVESLISHPASMTHGSVPPDERKRLGITDGLVRISIGIEETADLLEDLERALEKL